MINKNKKKQKLIIIIPARLNSKRLNQKLLRKINGIPMIVRVAKAAIKTKLGEVYVASDSKKITNLCDLHKIKSLITSSKLKSGTDRVYEAYKKINKNYDLIINLQGDLPIFDESLLKKIVDLFSDSKTDIGSAICDLTESEREDKNIVKAYVNLDKKKQGFAVDFFRQYKRRIEIYHHIGIYVYKPSILKRFVDIDQTKNEKIRSLEQMSALDNNMKIKLIKVENNPPSVDTLDDLKKIRLLFNGNKY